ncbi:universal stress protein [Companilactobacillus crustorum]|uniref:Universal stress protein n=3 Tax=Companilactobacillus TaxID=2767879 RepID=A0A837RJ52_9LACO|nr:universal stress protein [Companilactobacillus crustorum]HCD07129.1 universal stress protein [Lactobacillus sp.]KRK43969.1 UspA family nucleotide-binding protein [Companilactobacillus crustorum JCM 15951]KRO21409.1 UspA family nucleotide-binding protein [Companilactobacillus crustorum]WDT66716.1 universal stress protein [Companilactobacillus crustorum]GEO75871.1 universal stress protein [Companilactobacillus crustorum]
MYKKILVAIDGSQSAYNALNSAIDLAKQFGSELYLVSVVNTANLPMNVGVSYAPGLTKDLQESAKKDLKKAVDLVKEKGLTYQVQLLDGEPREQLTRFPKENDIDLIVMGKTGTSAFTRVFVGSVTRYVSEHSDINILIVV